MSKTQKSSIPDSIASYDFELYFSNLLASKYWIIGLSLLTTICIVAFGFIYSAPTYKASAKMKMGIYNVPQLECRREIRELEACKEVFAPKKALMMAPQVVNNIDIFSSENISNSIDAISSGDYSLEIISIANSTDEAKKSLEKIINFISQSHIEITNDIINRRSKLIKSYENNINNLITYESDPHRLRLQNKLAVVKRQIRNIKNNKLPNINSSLNEFKLLMADLEVTNEKLLEEQKNNIEKSNYYDASRLLEIKDSISLFESYILISNNQLNRLETELQKIPAMNYELLDKKYKTIQVVRNDIFLKRQQLLELLYKFLASLQSEKDSLENSLQNLKDEELMLVEFEIPNNQLALNKTNREISNRTLQINEIIKINRPSSYTRTSLIGEIKSSEKQFTPNLTKYALFGFLSSFIIFMFIFSIFKLYFPIIRK